MHKRLSGAGTPASRVGHSSDACLDKLWSYSGDRPEVPIPPQPRSGPWEEPCEENVFASNPPERNFNAEFLGAATVIPEPSTLVLAGLGRAVGCSGDENDLQLRSRWLPW